MNAHTAGHFQMNDVDGADIAEALFGPSKKEVAQALVGSKLITTSETEFAIISAQCNNTSVEIDRNGNPFSRSIRGCFVSPTEFLLDAMAAHHAAICNMPAVPSLASDLQVLRDHDIGYGPGYGMSALLAHHLQNPVLPDINTRLRLMSALPLSKLDQTKNTKARSQILAYWLSHYDHTQKRVPADIAIAAARSFRHDGEIDDAFGILDRADEAELSEDTLKIICVQKASLWIDRHDRNGNVRHLLTAATFLAQAEALGPNEYTKKVRARWESRQGVLAR